MSAKILRAMAWPRFKVWKILGCVYLTPYELPCTKEEVPEKAVFKSFYYHRVEEFILSGLDETNRKYLQNKKKSKIQVNRLLSRQRFEERMAKRKAVTPLEGVN